MKVKPGQPRLQSVELGATTKVSKPTAEVSSQDVDLVDRSAQRPLRARHGSTPGTPPARAGVSGAEHARLSTLQGGVTGAVTSTTPAEDVAHAREFRLDLLKAYYPFDHPKLHVSEDPLNLNRLGGVGRKNENGRLLKVALSPPYALAGEWRFSPMAQAKGFEVDLDQAFEQHARLTKYLLDRGVEVYLQIQPEAASEAVYATDVVTGIGKTAMIGNPKHEARRLETKGYTGGIRLERFGGETGPIEFGDVQLFEKDGVQYVFQAFNSWRGTQKSVEAMGDALEEMKKRGLIGEYQHVPIELTGEGTLHLDYVFGYAGDGDQRGMVVHPEGLKDPKIVDRLAEILDVPEERVIRIDTDAMLAGAANLSSLDPTEVLYLDNEYTRVVADQLRSFGLTVTMFPYDQMSQKDGTTHCSIGQLARA